MRRFFQYLASSLGKLAIYAEEMRLDLEIRRYRVSEMRRENRRFHRQIRQDSRNRRKEVKAELRRRWKVDRKRLYGW